MAEKSLVLAASRYDFTSDDGKRIRGAKLQILEPKAKKEPDRFGRFVAEVVLDGDVFEAFQGHPLPAYFELELGVSGGSKGKANMIVTGAKFVHAFADTPALKAAA